MNDIQPGALVQRNGLHRDDVLDFGIIDSKAEHGDLWHVIVLRDGAHPKAEQWDEPFFDVLAPSLSAYLLHKPSEYEALVTRFIAFVEAHPEDWERFKMCFPHRVNRLRDRLFGPKEATDA